ncbi:hypothetical protein [Geodermatophilus maliterrae]|uniref:Uncharacterized protein n=1 Tax=Geodermatophilus maliterrae TaxID=3162531 RepID=A0ABV3XKF7_9ACTN
MCLVTEDHRRTMEGLARLGIGAFRVYTFDAGNTVDRTGLPPVLVTPRR